MAVLDSDDENHVNEVVLDATKGVSKDYVDHGDQTLTCGLCFANLWPTEGGKGRITLQKQTYSLCCGYGKVDLPEYKDSDQSYQMLFRGLDQESKYFLKNIRRYNSMFSFTSMGGKVDTKINKGNAPFVYRISGQNAHSMGSLLPKHGAQPKFSQLYIYDTENELSNRELFFSDSSSKASIRAKELDVKFIKYITNMLDSTNMLVKTYRMVRDHLHDNPNVTLKLRIISQRDRDGRTYNLPTCSEVAALIVDEPDLQIESRDIIVEMRSGELKRISELHPSYLALQYPILFPYGGDGYRINIPHREFGPNSKKTRPTCTMREFFAYRIQDRHNKFSLILNARRLFQQFLVDAYTMIESERLNYIRFQQIKLRSDSLNSLKNVQDVGQSDLSHTGQPVILPSSFTGGSRYMMQNYLDAMALCRKYGYPDFFITITCNPKWPEIVRFLGDSSIKPEDRPDILCRLFFIEDVMAPAFVKIIYDASPSSLDSFYHVMMFPEAKNLVYVKKIFEIFYNCLQWLPKKIMEHNFNDDILKNNVTIRYAPNQERTVRIKKLWDIHYYILDFSQISTDLSLVKWDFLVFHRVETYTFSVIVFRLLGDGSLVAEIGIPLPELKAIPEPEYQAENDIEVGHQHSQTEDQIPIEDINYDNDVNVDNQVYDDEEFPVDGNPPLPVNDVYEIEWVLTYRFRFPQRFVENVPLDNVKSMNVQTMNGVNVVLEIRSERSRGATRYAFRGWERFMRQVGLLSGRAYVLRYERNNGVLLISEVIPHIF
ncbi:putative transcription factor B3-Domain family [Helianthus debilis subsp. tardiflorus]